MAWDGAAAKAHLKDWATADGEMDMAKYKTGFAWIDAEAPDMMGSCKLPHHDIVDGTFVVVRSGVQAAANVIQGSRGGVEIPAGEVAGVRRHLATHFNQFGIEPPWTGSAAKSGTELTKKGSHMEQLRTILGLAEDADVEAAVAALVADLAAVKEQVASLTADKATLEGKVNDLTASVSTQATEAEAALTAARGEVVKLTAVFDTGKVELQKKIDTLTAEKAEREAKDRINDALTLGKVTPAELEAEDGFLKGLAKDQPEMFDRLMGTLREDRSRTTVLSQDGDPQPDTNIDELFALVDAECKQDPTLTRSDARLKVFARRPDLKALTEKEA
jgi:hypothetical protein